MLRLQTCLLFTFLLTLSNGQPFLHMLRGNCDSSVEFMPNMPFGANAKIPLLQNAYNAAIDSLWDRASCSCPDATREDFRLFFDPFAVILNNAKGTPNSLNSCLAANFTRNLNDLGFFRIPSLPDTCTINTYLSGKCTFKHSFPLIDATLEVSLFKCSNNWFPGFSITCSGTACANLGKPCNSDSECGGGPLKCFDFESKFGENFTRANIDDGVFNILKEMKIYDESEASPGCFQNRGSSPRSKSNDVLYNILTFVRNVVFSASGDAPNLKICGINQVFSFEKLLSGNQTSMEDSFLNGITADIARGEEAKQNSCLFSNGNEELKNYFFQVGSGSEITWQEMVSSDASLSKCFRRYSSSYDFNDRDNEYNCDKSGVDGPHTFQSSMCNRLRDFQTKYHEYYDLGDRFDRCNNNANDCDISGKDLNSQIQQDIITLFKESLYSLDYNDNGILEEAELNFQLQCDNGNCPNGGFLNLARQIRNRLQNVRNTRKSNDLKERYNQKLSAYDSNLSGSTNITNTFLDKFFSPLADLFQYISEGLYDCREFPESFFLSKLEALKGTFSQIDANSNNTIDSSEVPSSNQLGNTCLQIIEYQLGSSVGVNRSVFEREVEKFFNDQFRAHYLSSGNMTVPQFVQFKNFLDGRYDMYNTMKSDFTLPTTYAKIKSTLIQEGEGLIDSQSTEGYLDSDFFQHPKAMVRNTISSSLSSMRTHLFLGQYFNILDGYSIGPHDRNSDQMLSDWEIRSMNWGLERELYTLGLFYSRESVSWEDFESSRPIFETLRYNSTVVITVPGLQSWDGKDSTGKDVSTITTVLPPFSRVPSKFNIFRLTCDQNILFENQNVGIVFRNMPSITNHFAQLMFDLVSCRTTPPSTSVAQFLTRYGIYSPFFWLYVLDRRASGFELPAGIDLVRFLFDPQDGDTVRIENLPDSCNFERYLKEGICEIDFVGFSELLLLDINIRLTAKACGSNSYFASYLIECVGKDCPLLLGLQACDQTSDCFGSTKCQYIIDFVGEIAKVIEELAPTESPTQSPTGSPSGVPTGPGSPSSPSNGQGDDGGAQILEVLKNKTLIEDIILDTDWLDILFRPEQDGSLCTEPSAFSTPFEEVIGSSIDKQCSGPTRWRRNVHDIMVKVLGSPNQKSNLAKILNFCLIDPISIANAEFGNWAISLAEFDQGSITLGTSFKNVVAPPTSPPTSPPTQSPTEPPTQSPDAPTIPPVTLPTCRCRSNCGTLSPSLCAACYASGGEVMSNSPGACYCQSSTSTISLLTLTNYNYNSTLCPTPQPVCSNCNGCDNVCLTCFGKGSDQCLSCSNPSKTIVYTSNNQGLVQTGKCLDPCQPGQVRNPDGECASPDCSSLSNCSGKGTCLYSAFSLTSFCRCNEGSFGSSCAQSVNCSAYNNCNGNGKCIFNQFFRDSRCSCNSGWSGDSCTVTFLSINPSSDSQLGGSEIAIKYGGKFSEQVNCQFGSSSPVEGRLSLDSQTVYCIVPPSSFSRSSVTVSLFYQSNPSSAFATSINGFFYYDQEIIPHSPILLNELFWTAGEQRTIEWEEGDIDSPNVDIKLYKWQWDQHNSPSQEPQLILVDTLATSTQNDGSESITLPTNLVFSWSSSLYILSIIGPNKHFNRYIIPQGNPSNFAKQCSDWILAEKNFRNAQYQNELPACPPTPFTWDFRYRDTSTCNRWSNGYQNNCYLNVGASICLNLITSSPSRFGGRTCCYQSSGNLITDRSLGGGILMRYGVTQSNQYPFIRNFFADTLPDIICCHKSNVNCTNFSEVRPTDNGIPWQPPAGGRGFGDPHLVTLDGSFWTFNAIGEFVLIENPSANFSIHGRLEKLGSSKATSLTAISVKDGSEEVSAYGNENGEVTFFIGKTLVTETIEEGGSYQSPNGKIFIFGRAQGSFDVLIPSGVIVQISPEVLTLSVFSVLPRSFFGKTRGLLGTWNNNKADDFTLRNGNVIPSNSETEDLFFDFGMTYAVTAKESRFLYPSGKTHTDFNKLDFVPDFFKPNFTSPEFESQAKQACQGAISVEACLFDVAQTGNLQTAKSSIRTASVFQSFSVVANSAPVVTGFPSTVSGRLNEVVVIPFTASDPEGKTLTFNIVSGPSGKVTSNSFTFTMDIGLYFSQSIPDIRIIVQDPDGGSTVISAKVTTVRYDCTTPQGLISQTRLEMATACFETQCTEECKTFLINILKLDCSKAVSDGVTGFVERQKACCDNTSLKCPTEGGNSSTKLTGGQIAGIVIGGIAAIFIIVALVVFCIMKGKKGGDNATEMKIH